MLSVYFDTNVYDHIHKGYVPAEDVKAVRAALEKGDLVAHLSVADVEELLGQWESDREAAVRKLGMARDLAGFDRMLKPPATLLEDAIRAFAAGAPVPAVTLPRQERRSIASALHRVAKGNRALSAEVSRIVADVRAIKEEFRRRMREALDRTVAELKLDAYGDEERRALKFEAFWTRAATPWAEAFAERVGVTAACRERGIDGLLDVRAVRLGVGAPPPGGRGCEG